jgi:hypothetical protein
MKASFVAFVVIGISAIFAPQEAFALTISPTKIEVAGDPGQTIIGEIELFNEQAESKTFFTSYENFEPRGETGSPYFVGGGTGLATWITTSPSITIAPGERVELAYTITIPNDAVPGGYFGAIFFGSQPPATGENGGEVAIGGKVGSLVLLRVNGDVVEGGGLLEFTSIDERFFFANTPVAYTYRFNNTGGDRVIPRGELVVTNLWGGVAASIPANSTEGSVLPSSIRRFESTWGVSDIPPPETFWQTVRYQLGDFHVGLYKATLSLSWGESAQSATATNRIFIFPWQLLSVVGTVLVGLIVLLRFYNKMIIARARRGQ